MEVNRFSDLEVRIKVAGFSAQTHKTLCLKQI